MSVYQNLYVGPYAEWLVQAGEDDYDLLEELVHPALRSNTGQDGIPEVRVKGVYYRRHCFIPRVKRLKKPQRCMDFDETVVAVEDWNEVDRQAEIDWFAKAFEKELNALASHYGREPHLRWGMVAWLS
jgi:hypothetical protein